MPSGSTIDIMLVDDSFTVRGFLRRIIEKDPNMRIVASVSDGAQALKMYDIYNPDLIIMDIEMPNMDGLTAVKELKKKNPDVKIIMCSSLTQKGAAATFEALQNGASDYLTKPSSQTIDLGMDFESQLIYKIRNLVIKSEYTPSLGSPSDAIALKKMPGFFKPKAFLIGASTGGPTALISIFEKISKNISIPIFITQHIPLGFTAYLAETIAKKTGFKVFEAAEGMIAEPGNIYIAPGGKHMGVHADHPHKISLIDLPPVQFCKPSIDVMLESFYKAHHDGLLIVLLTGMGSDGLDSCRLLSASEKNVIVAQDEKSSVVWGIPGAVAKAGLCHSVLPLQNIPDFVNRTL